MWSSIAIVAVLGFVQINAQVEFCVQCESNGSTDIDCVTSDGLDRFIQACPAVNTTGTCFTQITHEGFTRRGCGSHLNGTECEGELCNVCQLIAGGSTPCNTLTVPVDRLTCYECNGDMNSTCASLNGTDVRPITCPIYRREDRCFATRAGGSVSRGCLSSAGNRCDNDVCTLCIGHGCNDLEGPELNSAFATQVVGKSLLLVATAVALMRVFAN